MYFDSLPMLTLFRGGPTVWMNKEMLKKLVYQIKDWIGWLYS
ncbi:Respiratory nitrate reductase alpha chain [Bacillus thuringiensis serovar israelensis ATCC 35646]|nr:Respiratory nitrate reductase alpha chain [Bacillus thuringiensis serovar israelensis ATCC 35646]